MFGIFCELHHIPDSAQVKCSDDHKRPLTPSEPLTHFDQPLAVPVLNTSFSELGRDSEGSLSSDTAHPVQIPIDQHSYSRKNLKGSSGRRSKIVSSCERYSSGGTASSAVTNSSAGSK